MRYEEERRRQEEAIVVAPDVNIPDTSNIRWVLDATTTSQGTTLIRNFKHSTQYFSFVK